MEVSYKDYMKLPEDIRAYLSQFNVSERHIPLIRKGMFNRNQTLVELNALGSTTVLGKPSQIKVSDEGIIIGLPTISFLVPYEICKEDLVKHNYNPDELFSDFCIYNLTTVRKQTQYGSKSETHCMGYKVIAQVANRDEANKLIEEYGGLGAFTRILGWKPIPEINRLNFTRLFSIISGNHIFQLTPPNTGKTHLASRLSLGLNFGYFTEKITPARLIFNAANKTQGEVFLRDGIIIDEMVVIREVRELEENLLSGLENGIWSRGVSGAEHLEENVRRIPFLFFGNLINRRLGSDYNGRDELKRILEDLKFTNINAFTERIALCDLTTRRVNAGGQVMSSFYTNSVLRGLIEILKEEYRKIRPEIDTEYFPENSRFNRYAQDLEAYCNVISLDAPTSVIKNIVEGYISELDNLFYTEEKPKETVDYKDKSVSIAERVVEYLQSCDGADLDTLIKELDVSEEELEPVLDNLIRYNEIIYQDKKYRIL